MILLVQLDVGRGGAVRARRRHLALIDKHRADGDAGGRLAVPHHHLEFAAEEGEGDAALRGVQRFSEHELPQNPAQPAATFADTYPSAMTAQNHDRRERMRRLLEELIGSWNVLEDRRFSASVWSGTDEEKHRRLTEFLTLFGLSAHVHRLARAIMHLHDAGMTLEALPLVRQAFECSVTAQWVSLVNDALPSLNSKEIRQRRNLLQTLAEANYFDSASEDWPSEAQLQTIEQAPTGGRTFRDVCDDLEPGGAKLYALYRAMSSICHASLKLVDEYLDVGDETAVPTPLFAPRPAPDVTAEAWVGLTLTSVILAGRAVDRRMPEHPRRTQLKAATREAGIAREVTLSAAAFRRNVKTHRRAR